MATDTTDQLSLRRCLAIAGVGLALSMLVSIIGVRVKCQSRLVPPTAVCSLYKGN